VELDRPASPTTPVAAITHASAGSAWLVDRQMALADQWDELVDQVRALPGLEAFLRPPQIEELRPAAAGGPVVVVNVSQWRCDALLVTDTGTRVVELSAVTHDIVSDHATSYLDALQNYESTAVTPATMHTVGQVITTILEWLRDAIAQPVLIELGHEGLGPDQVWPRLWWYPTGPLAVLPLHAAGYHHPAHNHRGRSVLDRAVSSYTPTLRALAQARRTRPRPVSTDAHSHLLIIALRHTPGQPELPSVDRERDLLVRLLPS
jgi:CHAT domain